MPEPQHSHIGPCRVVDDACVKHRETPEPHQARHGATAPVPPEALLAADFELHLVRAPLVEPGTSCRYEACESDEACTCQEALDG